MNKNIVFFCSHQHGDILQTRQGIRYIIKQLGSSYKYYFIHGKDPESIFVHPDVTVLRPPINFHATELKDVKIHMINNFYPFLKDALWLNVWVGAVKGSRIFTLKDGCKVLLPNAQGFYSLDSSEEIKFTNNWHVRMYQERIQEINEYLLMNFSSKKLTPPTTEDLIVEWNSNPKNKQIIDDLLTKNDKYKVSVILCNGRISSSQNTNFIYEDILRDYIVENQDICFYLTSKISEIKSNNVFYIDDYVPLPNLNEIEYLMKFCDVIVHSFSGPAVCSFTDAVLNDANKTVISFCYLSFPPFYDNFKYKHVRSEDFSEANILKIISENILEKLK